MNKTIWKFHPMGNPNKETEIFNKSNSNKNGKKIIAWIYLVAVVIAAVYGVYLMYILDPHFFKAFALTVVIIAGLCLILWLTILALDKIKE